MIKFNSADLQVSHVHLKSVTAALGGAIRVLDERKTKKAGKEVFSRIAVDQSIIRDFVKRYKTSKFLVPIEAAIITYKKMVVAMERGPVGGHILKRENPSWKWVPDCLDNINTLINTTRTGTWYTDGRHVYSLDESDNYPISKNGKFHAVNLQAFMLTTLNAPAKIFKQIPVSAIAYQPSKGGMKISAPLFKKHGSLGVLSDNKNDIYSIDRMKEHHAVNLDFCLYAGKLLSDTFGHDVLDPLQLPKLMVQMKTVNLPRLSREVKNTTDCHLPIENAIAWLIGIGEQTKKVEDYKVVRSVLKHLLAKGIFNRSKLHVDAVFRDNHHHDTIPLLSVTEALEAAAAQKHIGSVIDWMIEKRKKVEGSEVGNG